MRLHYYSYRFAEEVLSGPRYQRPWREAQGIFQRLPLLPATAPKAKSPVDQGAMNAWLDVEFKKKRWSHHPRIVKGTMLAGDYRKKRIQIEVQFGNIARYAYDLFKFQICYSRDTIDIGILVVALQPLAKGMGQNIAYFERVRRELPHAKLSITLPIMVIGLEPTSAIGLLPPQNLRGVEK